MFSNTQDNFENNKLHGSAEWKDYSMITSEYAKKQ